MSESLEGYLSEVNILYIGKFGGALATDEDPWMTWVSVDLKC